MDRAGKVPSRAMCAMRQAEGDVHLSDVVQTCAKCGLVHARCRAHSKRRTEEGKLRPCMGHKIPGLAVCYFHGGHTNASQAAAARHVALAKAGELLGVPKDVDPAEALLAAVNEAAGNVEFLRNQLQVFQLSGGELGRRTSGDQLVVNATLELYNRERDRLAEYCRLAINAGVAERQVRVAERQGAMLAALVTALLSDPGLALTQAQQAMGRQVAARLMAAHALPAHTQSDPLVQDTAPSQTIIEAEKSSATT